MSSVMGWTKSREMTSQYEPLSYHHTNSITGRIQTHTCCTTTTISFQSWGGVFAGKLYGSYFVIPLHEHNHNPYVKTSHTSASAFALPSVKFNQGKIQDHTCLFYSFKLYYATVMDFCSLWGQTRRGPNFILHPVLLWPFFNLNSNSPAAIIEQHGDENNRPHEPNHLEHTLGAYSVYHHMNLVMDRAIC